jgi:hypothetical protein
VSGGQSTEEPPAARTRLTIGRVKRGAFNCALAAGDSGHLLNAVKYNQSRRQHDQHRLQVHLSV